MDPNKANGYNFYYNRMDFPSNLGGQLSSNMPPSGMNQTLPAGMNPSLGQGLAPGSQQLAFANMMPLMYPGGQMLSLGMQPQLLFNHQLNGLSGPIYGQGQLSSVNTSGLQSGMPQNSGSGQHLQPGQQPHLASMLGSSGRPELLSSQPDPRFAHAYMAGYGPALQGGQPNYLYQQAHALQPVIDYQPQHKNKERDAGPKNFYKEKDTRHQFSHEQNGPNSYKNLNANRDKDDRSHVRPQNHGQPDTCTRI